MFLNLVDYVDVFIFGGRVVIKLEKYEDVYYCYKVGLKIVLKYKEIIEDLKEFQKIIIKDVEMKVVVYEERDYNVVDFCMQDFYLGDVDLFKLEVEILEKKYKIKMEIFLQKFFDNFVQ